MAWQPGPSRLFGICLGHGSMAKAMAMADIREHLKSFRSNEPQQNPCGIPEGKAISNCDQRPPKQKLLDLNQSHHLSKGSARGFSNGPHIIGLWLGPSRAIG